MRESTSRPLCRAYRIVHTPKRSRRDLARSQARESDRQSARWEEVANGSYLWHSFWCSQEQRNLPHCKAGKRRLDLLTSSHGCHLGAALAAAFNKGSIRTELLTKGEHDSCENILQLLTVIWSARFFIRDGSNGIAGPGWVVFELYVILNSSGIHVRS
jgi:hypothetical protein